MYNILDVIDRGMEISKKKQALYKSVCEDIPDPAIQLVLRVILKAIEKENRHYESMKRNITKEMADEIDFATYDKISSLINQFLRVMIAPNIHTKDEFVSFVIDLEEKIHALLVDVQGRMVVSEAVASSVSYYVLSEAIQEKEKYINKLKGFRAN